MKYDDLIKRLRTECILPYATLQLMREAADAIEELRKVLDVVNNAHNEGFDVGYWAGRRDYEPKWIPVTEWLPDENDVVLITDSLNVGTGYLVHGYGWISPFDDIETSYVSHWMPLPETPEESKT